MKRLSLSGNALKIIAMITMTLDHVGVQLLPQYPLLRILGRLALPIYGYMIAEGCRHTKSRKRYLLRLAAMAALCQLVYFIAMGSLYMCILVTFSLSICLIWAWESEKKAWLAPPVTAAVFFLCVILPELVPEFYIDYGLPGVMLPVLIYFGKNKAAALSAGLLLLALAIGGNQWCAFAALPLLMLYNGQRGTARIGGLFYWYYPIHLAVIYLVSLLL